MLDKGMSYEESGVVGLEGLSSFERFLVWIKKSLKGHPEVKTEIGLYATVVKIAPKLAIALSTDGVGTKLLVAELIGKYDTVGIDCVAMNVNDIICVGAKPIAMLDYIAVQDVSKEFMEDLGKGLYAGAKEAGISIPGGELAQLREMIKGIKEGYGFDLVGCAVGVMEPNKLIVGEGIKEGDLVIGLGSSGLHSNGYTLARRVLLSKWKVDDYIEDLGRTLGEELIEPTRIYVKPAIKMLSEGIKVKAFLHITGDGFRNLRRVRSKVGFVLDKLPEPPAIFNLIQKVGGISQEEMANTFNLGIGFCVVVSEKDGERVIKISKRFKIPAQVIGYAVRDAEKKVVIPGLGVVGKEKRFYPLG